MNKFVTEHGVSVGAAPDLYTYMMLIANNMANSINSNAELARMQRLQLPPAAESQDEHGNKRLLNGTLSDKSNKKQSCEKTDISNELKLVRDKFNDKSIAIPEKLLALHQANKLFVSPTTRVEVSAHRTFFQKMKKVSSCIDNCFAGDCLAFADALPKDIHDQKIVTSKLECPSTKRCFVKW